MKNLKYYLSLMAILSIGLGLFWIFNFNRFIQMLIIITLGGAYIFWGITHHLLEKDFHWRLIWEYLIVAAIACIVVISLLIRS